jgi:hypothetical protein
VIEVVAVEFVDPVAVRAGAHKAIENPVVVPADRAASHNLVREVASDYSGLRLWIVRLANLRQQEQSGVTEGERAKDDQVGAEAVNPGETGWLDNYCGGETSAGLLIQAGPGKPGGTGAWRTKRSGCAA